MKKYLKFFLPVLLMFVFADLQAQKKKVSTKKSTQTKTVKVIERNFGTPAAITEITDVSENAPSYSSVKNLIENNGVIFSYADNTFRAKEPLKRGDFIVALNSALNNLKTKIDPSISDTGLFNTYDRNRGGAYLTTIDQVKGLPETSIYYPASKSLIEEWGIAAPFALNKTLASSSVMTEKEVYDILGATLGYRSPGLNPYSTGMNRGKFAIVFNNAISQKMTEIRGLNSAELNRRDMDRRRQVDSLKVVDKARKDSVAKDIELRKIEAARLEIEARKEQGKKKK